MALVLTILTALTGAPPTSHASDTLIESVFVHVPRGLSASTPARVLVAFHGLNDNGPSLGRQLIEEADRRHWVLVVPTLRYGDWWAGDVLAREDVLVSRWLREYLDHFERERGVALQPKMLLFGFSRGAGLVDRIALIQPERVLAAAVVSSGAYTLPLTKNSSGASLVFPYGVADLANHTGKEFNAQAFASIRWWVGVGGKDDDFKDVPQAWSAHGGATRLERARSFSSALTQAGAETRLAVFANTGHRMITAMREQAMLSLIAADPAPIVVPPPPLAAPKVTPTATPRSTGKAPSRTAVPVKGSPPTSTATSASIATPVRVVAASVVGRTEDALPPGPVPTPNIVPPRPLAPIASIPAVQSPAPAEPAMQASEVPVEPTRSAIKPALGPKPVDTLPEPQPGSPPPVITEPQPGSPPPVITEPRVVAPAHARETGDPAIKPPVAPETEPLGSAPPDEGPPSEPPPAEADQPPAA
jgi:pimeloyl-ACP methyl ester carboxylesterase